MSDIVVAEITAPHDAKESTNGVMAPDTPHPPRRAPSIRDAVVTVLGVIGMLVVVWLLAAWLFSLTVIVFVSGSMSPTMPTGTAAVTQTVAAAELQVGDVVTVPRSRDGVDVTHRVVAIDAVAGSPDERSLTLKGDDNDAPDREQYLVDHAGRVIASLPGAGWAVMWLKSTAGIITITVVAAAVAAWGLWPSRRDRTARRD